MLSVETIEQNGKRTQQVEIDCEDTAYMYYDLMSVIRHVFERVGSSEEIITDIHSMIDDTAALQGTSRYWS
ncbi:MAG: hypothetical protein VB031_03550 [Eubacteriaceae bacterium]|nr:hypothetical protein [Eubacteriaceae bacterium]